MTTVAVHNLCINCRYATTSNDMYRYHMIQHEDGARLPACHDLRCSQTLCMDVAYNPVDYNHHVEQYHKFNATECIRNLIYRHMLNHTVTAPEYVPPEPAAERDPWLARDQPHPPSPEYQSPQ